MKTKYSTLLLTGFFLLLILNTNLLAADNTVEGSWTARIKDDKVRMTLSIFRDDIDHGDWNTTSYFPKNEFSDLQMDKEHGFTLTRTSGELKLYGKFSQNRGFGDFEFNANPEFKEYLNQKGFDDLKNEELFHLFIRKIDKNYIGYREAEL